MILMSHRQAWCWQDEYVDLTIDDVRKLELETQHYLNLKMRNDPDAENYLRSIENMSNNSTDSGSIVSKKSDEKPSNKKFKSHESNKSPAKEKTKVADQVAPVAKPRRTSLAKSSQLVSTASHQEEGVVSEVAASSGSDDSFASQKNTENNENSDYEDIVSDEEQGHLTNGRLVSKKTLLAKASKKSSGKLYKPSSGKANNKTTKIASNTFEFEIEEANQQGSDEFEEEDCTSQNSNFDEFYDAICKFKALY